MSKAPQPTQQTLAELEANAARHQAAADDLQRRAAREQSVADGYRKAAKRVHRALRAITTMSPEAVAASLGDGAAERIVASGPAA